LDVAYPSEVWQLIVERTSRPSGIGYGIERCRLVDVVDGFRQVLADVPYLASRDDVGAPLPFNLQIELLNESRPELGRFGYERESRYIRQVRDAWRSRNRQPLIKGRWRARYGCAARVLRGGIDSLVLFNLNRQAGLTVRTEHRGERGVLEVGVGGVVAGEEAKSVASAHNR